MRNKFLNITATIPNYWNILFDVMSDMAQKVNLSQSSLGSKKHQFNFSPDKIIKIVMIMILIIGAYLLGGRLTNSAPNYQNDRIEAPRAKAKQTLNKTLNIPIKDEKGKEISNIKYVIESVELQDEIIVKGQKAKAVKGRTFFIINIKITNEYKKGIEINTRDYIRLSVNNSKEDLAADIHNDPVGIQAISTKLTRLGFPINDSDKDLTLQIGEINGKKYSTHMAFFPKSDSKKILDEIEKELEEIIYGSIEIYVHDREVTQISVRKIQKTNIKVKGNRQMPHPPQSKKHESSIKTDSKMGLDK